MASVIPMLAYRDGPAAMDWLIAAQGPALHREHCAEAAAWSEVPYVIDGVLVEVDDLDAHFERAKVGGARILSDPEDAGGFRHYRAEDLEGHRWMFSGQ